MEQLEVILGVDTHLDMYVGAVISETGKFLGTLSVAVETAGYFKLLSWAKSLGHLRRAGVEGASSYGANAVAESFFATLNNEEVTGVYETKAGAHAAIASYIHSFYNPTRLHSALGYLSPNDYARRLKLAA